MTEDGEQSTDSQSRSVAGRPLTLGEFTSPTEVKADGPRFEAVAGEAQLAPLLKVPLDVRVVLGTAQRKLSELAQIQPGSLLELDSIAGEPVLLTVSGTPFARAEVVVIDDQYAVRISELLQDLATMVDAVGQSDGGRP